MPQTSTRVSDNKLNLFFGLSLAMITAYFVFWGVDYTNHNHLLVFVLASISFMIFNTECSLKPYQEGLIKLQVHLEKEQEKLSTQVLWRLK
ncbi:MAG: hypothetical protein U9O64_06690 [Campylobacterota bacterium]|nr:hypothetical protein [Campylobacterota bacterium]